MTKQGATNERFISDFPVGAELEIECRGKVQWVRLCKEFPGGGGWVRPIGDDGQIDNSREGLVIVTGREVVRASRKVPAVKKRKRRAGLKKTGWTDPSHF